MTTKQSTELTLKDKLSRLTLREAVKLLGPEGEQLIRMGGTFEIVDFPGQVLLSHDRFELRLPAATVAVSLKDDARRRLHWTCDACSRRRCGIPALTRSDPLSGTAASDAVGRRLTKARHPIQDVAPEQGLGLSPGCRPGSQPSSDGRFVPKDDVLHARLSMVSRGLRPASTSEDLHAPDRPIADAGPRSASRQRRRSGRRHHDHRGSRAGRVVERDGVVRRIGRHARDIAVDVVDQTDAGRGIIRRRLGERMGDDDASAVDTEMQLLPAPLPAPAVFGGGPFALAEDGQARAVDDEMQWLLHGNAIECKIEAPAPPRERGVVWRCETGVHQAEDRPLEALRLAQR